MKTLFNPPTLAKPSGFTHGILTEGGRLLTIAGQTALDASGQIVHPNDIVNQFRKVLSNIQTIVTAAGGQMTDIVRFTIYVTNKADYKTNLKAIGDVYQSFFGKYYPAMALIEIKSLWDDAAMIEIESTAVLPN
jgi:enamine deaminase RidA (YjgF/YER057c/UK114 family)